MSDVKLGTEKIEAMAKDLTELIIVAKKVTKDKKVNFEDVPHFVSLVTKLPAMFEHFKAYDQAIAEGKDLDITEVVALIQFVHAEFKKVEAA